MKEYDIGNAFLKRAEEDATWNNMETAGPLTIEGFRRIRAYFMDEKVKRESLERKIKHDQRMADFWNAFDWEKMADEEPNACWAVGVSVGMNHEPIVPPGCVEILERYRK